MKNVNFIAIEEHVSSQYGDLTGVIQLDGHSNISSMYDLCKDYNFDTRDIFIIGFGLEESTIDGIGKKYVVNCSVFYVEKAEYGNNFEEIERKIKEEDTVTLKKKDILINYSDLGKYIKRYQFIVTSSLINYVKNINIESNDQ